MDYHLLHDIMKVGPIRRKRFSRRELLYVISLNRSNKILSVRKIRGNSNSVTFADKDILKRASSHRIVLAHNHPSGDVRPSQDDMITINRLNSNPLFKLIDFIIFSRSLMWSWRFGYLPLNRR